jgi:hypothetical protein
MSESKLTDKYEDFMIFAGNDLVDYYITTIDDSVNFPKFHFISEILIPKMLL